ncbi:MAG: hypothetical protein WC943_10880, partial [Elusimicrobiota bacterium]
MLGLLLPAVLALLALAPSSALAAMYPRKIADTGTTKESNQRKIVMNDWGFWAFYSQGTPGNYSIVWSWSSS